MDMESPPNEKKFLYHTVPENMRGTELLSLSELETAHPDLFVSYMEKYKTRPHVPKQFIEYLNAHWNEVVMLSPVSPDEIKKELVLAGYNPRELLFYKIDVDEHPELFDPTKTAICLFDYDEEGNIKSKEYRAFQKEDIDAYSSIPKETISSYVTKIKNEEKPLMFLGIPHVLHKGKIDISNAPVITA